MLSSSSSLLHKSLQRAIHSQKRHLHQFKEITSPFGCMTKVICTLGPSTDSKEMIDKLVSHGMTVARLNFSHAGDDYTYPTKLMELVRSAPGRHERLSDGAYELRGRDDGVYDAPKNIRAILVDTKGERLTAVHCTRCAVRVTYHVTHITSHHLLSLSPLSTRAGDTHQTIAGKCRHCRDCLGCNGRNHNRRCIGRFSAIVT